MNRFSAGIATSCALLLATLVGGGFALASGTSGLSTTQIRTAAPSAVVLDGGAASEGSSLAVARADHSHSISGTLPVASIEPGTSTYVLTANGAGVAPSWQAASSTTRRWASDSNTLIRWDFDATSGNIANTDGSAGSNADLNSFVGTAAYEYAGIFNKALWLGSASITATSSASIQPAYPITLSVWWTPHSFGDVEIFYKAYRAASWLTPYIGVYLGCLDANGRATFGVTIGGSFSRLTPSDPRGRMITGIPNYLVGTYDGTTAKLYVNGSLVVSGAMSGAIDYNGASAGYWGVGTGPGNAATEYGIIDDASVETTAISAATVLARWQRATGRGTNTTPRRSKRPPHRTPGLRRRRQLRVVA